MLWTLGEYRAQWTKMGRMNHLPCPSLASSSPGITNTEGTTLWLTAFFVLLGPKAIKREAGAVPRAWLPATPIYFLVHADAGQALTRTLWALRKATSGEGWTRFQGHRQCGFWLCT